MPVVHASLSKRWKLNQAIMTVLATLLADHEFSAGCYLFTVSSSGLIFIHGTATGYPNFTVILKP